MVSEPRKKGLVLIFLISSSLPQAIQIDEKRLRQVLINLLGNAIKLTDNGSVTFKVDVISQESKVDKPQMTKDNEQRINCFLRFQIEDTGVGMSPDQLEKIFLPFEQVGSAGQRSEGTGLGLTISQRIAALMGSQIQVQSHLGEGSLFWLDLTALLAHEWNEGKTASNHQKITGVRGDAPMVLIVDDDDNHRSILTTLLQEIGCSYLEAVDGEQGLQLATEHQPDMILLDLAMPNMDGFELMVHLQAHSKTREIPIIVSSANVFESNRQRSLQAGATAFVGKPLQINELLNTLQTVLKVDWIYAQSTPQQSYKQEQVSNSELILPSQEVLQQLYHLAMMGDIAAIEGILDELPTQNKQLVPFVSELSKLTASFQTAKIRKMLKSFVIIESRQ